MEFNIPLLPSHPPHPAWGLLFFGRVDCSGSDSLVSDDSSLDFSADLGEAWFLFDRLSSSLSSNSSLESTAMRQDL